MDISVRKLLPGGVHEFVNELVVFFAASAWLAQTEIEVVV